MSGATLNAGSQSNRSIEPGFLVNALFNGNGLLRGSTFLLPCLFLTAVLLQPWADPRWMFMDPLTAAELSGDCCHTYYGFISNLGIMLWTITAGVCLFTGAMLVTAKAQFRQIWFALSAGVLTGWLALDDTFLLHELVLPSIGFPQVGVLALYVATAGLYAAASWRTILESDLVLFCGAALFFGVSIGIDVGLHSTDSFIISMEDSAKFMGLCFWASFNISTAYMLLSAAVKARRIAI